MNGKRNKPQQNVYIIYYVYKKYILHSNIMYVKLQTWFLKKIKIS